MARVHVGAGRPGISTGAGPVGYYASLSGGQRPRRATVTSRPNTGSSPQAVEKAEAARLLRRHLADILDLHRAEFATATRPIASPPPAVDTERIRAAHRRRAKGSTSIFARAERKAALADADRQAEHESLAVAREWETLRASWQQSLDERWNQLNANDPETVLGVLAVAFEDNDAQAAAVGVADSEASLIVMVPGLDAIPDRTPSITPAGNVSLQKMTKTDTADLYKQLVLGCVLVTVREALAVAPGLDKVRIAATRATHEGVLEVLAAAKFERESLDGAAWSTTSATDIVTGTSDELLWHEKGVTKALVPLDLEGEPELRKLVETVSLDG